jgi:hypothetical protein
VLNIEDDRGLGNEEIVILEDAPLSEVAIDFPTEQLFLAALEDNALFGASIGIFTDAADGDLRGGGPGPTLVGTLPLPYELTGTLAGDGAYSTILPAPGAVGVLPFAGLLTLQRRR